VNFHTTGSSIALVIDILRIGFALAIVFSFPIIIWEAKRGLEKQIWGLGLEYSLRRALLLNFALVTFCVILGALIPASALGLPLGFVGSTCSPLIMFILPCMMHQSLMEKRKEMRTTGIEVSVNQYEGQDGLINAVLIGGIVLIPLTFGVWIWQISVGNN
jgi:amino acid permease